MSAERKCRACGTDVPANAPFGHCPKCLIELGFGPLPDAVAGFAGSRAFRNYELLEEIGRGGMGVIYKARQIDLNRLVALKMVRPGIAGSATLMQRFRIEAEAAANLRHPNIVPIYETGEHAGQPFFSMALIDGTSLDRYIAEDGSGVARPGRPRDEQLARMMAKIARAVDHAHRHAVLHRDLKPSNIIVDNEGEPHLTDFGVAKVINEAEKRLTASGAIMGTPSYMAPEQAAGESKRVTTAADVYSLGAILYEMLTGRPPFQADTPLETLKHVVEREPKHPRTIREDVDRDLAIICMKCLEKEPHRRYPSAAALAEEFERWLRNEPITARPSHGAERLWRWCRRNPKVATLTGAVAVLLIALAAGSITVALRIKALNDSVARQNTHLRNEILNQLVEVYSDPNTEFYDIKSDMRRALAGHSARPVVFTSILELTNVLYVYEHPTNMLESVSPILDVLEEKLSQRLRRHVLIHWRMTRANELAHQALESDGLTFGRCGPASYVYLLDRGNGVRLLAMQDHKKPLTLALVTHTNSQIAQMQAAEPDAPLPKLLNRRSLALSHSTSTTGHYMPKCYLASNGVHAADIAGCTLFHGQRRVIDAVRKRQADFGAGNLELVDDYPDLRVIATVGVSTASDLGLCWVAGKGLNETIETHLRECLLELRDPAVLGKLESDVFGFKMMSKEALERLRAIIACAAEFDR